MSLVIVDYGMGNLGSIKNMLRYIGIDSIISSDNEQILKASKIILPGVGSFDSAMKNIKKNNLIKVLNHKALTDKIPILGICLGMQILTESSQEGVEKGLGWINAKTIKFSIDTSKFKVPHMGWNTVEVNQNNPLLLDFTKKTRFYFVHSYYVKVENEINSILKTKYEIKFDSAVHKENIYGVQFHPEKSHKNGMLLLKNFSNI